MDELSVKQRIREVLENKGSNPTKLSKEYSVNQKTLNNQINSDVQLSSSTLLLILNAFPDVSAEWLLRGKGDMFIQPIELIPEWNAKVDFVNEKEIKIILK